MLSESVKIRKCENYYLREVFAWRVTYNTYNIYYIYSNYVSLITRLLRTWNTSHCIFKGCLFAVFCSSGDIFNSLWDFIRAAFFLFPTCIPVDYAHGIGGVLESLITILTQDICLHGQLRKLSNSFTHLYTVFFLSLRKMPPSKSSKCNPSSYRWNISSSQDRIHVCTLQKF